MPKNKIKLLAANNFSWIENRSIQRFFQTKLERNFFSSQFDRDKVKKLVKDFNELNDADTSMSLDVRHGTTVVMAMRRWEYDLFEHLQK